MRTYDKKITADKGYDMHIYVRELGMSPREGMRDGALNVMIDERDHNIRIWGSHHIHSKRDKKAILSALMASDVYDTSIFKRNQKSYLVEWSVHNLAYKLFSFSDNRIRRSAADVDLNDGKSPAFKAIYYIATLNGLLDW